MFKLEPPVEIQIPDSQRALTFSTGRDVRTWIDKEVDVWSKFNIATISDANLRSLWQQQHQVHHQVIAALQPIESADESLSENEASKLRADLVRAFQPIANGLRLTRDSRWFPDISNLWKSSPDAAALVLVSARGDGTSLLGTFGQHSFPFSALVRAILRTGKGKGSDDWLQPQRDEVAALKSELERTRDALREQADLIGTTAANHTRSEEDAVAGRDAAWQSQTERVEEDWKRLIKTYDEAMAMAAPSTYWQKRATSHKNQAIAFGAVFAVILAVGLAFFFADGLPYLAQKAATKGQSIVLALVPVAVPAFALIWLMRMLGRMLGESLHMMRDAKERETMVKTFLAFVHDEERGKSLLLEQDRILILHALFRPSSVTSVDDSPPIHWFDILSSKMGDKGKS